MDNELRIELLGKLVEKIEFQTIRELRRDGLDCEANIRGSKVSTKEGKKYTKVDIGTSGRYMVDMDGNIYGIKAYGQVHKGHHYGTLETINDYYWGSYYPVKIG